MDSFHDYDHEEDNENVDPAIAVRHQPLGESHKDNIMTSPVTANDFQKHPLALAHLHSPRTLNIDALLGNGSLPSDAETPSTPTRGQSQSSTPVKSAEFTAIRSSLLEQPTQDTDERLAMTLFNGGHFIKFGRRGKPKPKFVVCSQDGILFWSDLTGGKTLTSIKLVQVIKVHTGKETDVFRKSAAKDIPEAVCLSVETKERTLDLQAESENQRDLWVKALRLAVENVQTVGKVTQQPVTSNDIEKKERSYDKRISKLQEELENTKKIIQKKNQEIIVREQKLVLERRNSQTELAKRDSLLEAKLNELERLKEQQTDLNRKIKVVHHERSASRQVHTGAYRDLELKLQALESEKEQMENKHLKEREQLGSIISDSKKLLAKAKDTIHKRQMSRAERMASYSALESEVKELRARNMELRTEAATAKTAQERAERELAKAKKIITLAKRQQVDLDEELARVENSTAGDEPVSNSPTETEEPSTVVGNNQHMTTIAEERGQEEKEAATATVNTSSSAARANLPSAAVNRGNLQIDFQNVVSEQLWQADDASENCPKCSIAFGLFTRKHHCRKCGSLACDDCSKSKAKVRQTGDKVRVCDECVKDLLGEMAAQ